MAGDHPPPFAGDRPQLRAHVPVQPLEVGFIFLKALAIGVSMRRVDGGQGSGDVVGINDTVARVLPGVRVGYRRGFARLGRRDRRNPVGGGHDDPAKLGRPGQPGEPAFEAQAVDDEELSLGKEPRLVRVRLEEMRIGVRADQAGDDHLAAADPAHDVVEDAEGNDDAYRRSRCRGPLAAPGEHQTESSKAAATVRDHGMSCHPSAIAKRAAS